MGCLEVSCLLICFLVSSFSANVFDDDVCGCLPSIIAQHLHLFVGSIMQTEAETNRINTRFCVFDNDLFLDFPVGLLQANTWILLMCETVFTSTWVSLYTSFLLPQYKKQSEQNKRYEGCLKLNYLCTCLLVSSHLAHGYDQCLCLKVWVSLLAIIADNVHLRLDSST